MTDDYQNLNRIEASIVRGVVVALSAPQLAVLLTNTPLVPSFTPLKLPLVIAETDKWLATLYISALNCKLNSWFTVSKLNCFCTRRSSRIAFGPL